MTERNTGGPAFPGKDEWDVRHGGMTLRDYFAAKAMQDWVGVLTPAQGAEKAYEWADAMLEARK